MTDGEFVGANAPVKTGFVREVIWQASNLLAVGTKVVPTVNNDSEHIDYYWSEGNDGEYPTTIDSETRMEAHAHAKVSTDMAWGKYAFMLRDSYKLRSMQRAAVARRDALKSASEWFADKYDTAILTSLKAGDATTQAAGNYWDVAAADPEVDIKSAWQTMLHNAHATIQEMKNLHLLCPTDVFGEFVSIQLINNVQVEMGDYLNKSLGLTLHPSRSSTLGTSAIMLIGGGETATMYQIDPGYCSQNNVPLVESWRVPNSGDAYMARNAFACLVKEDVAASGTTYRIIEITGVDA